LKQCSNVHDAQSSNAVVIVLRVGIACQATITLLLVI